MQESLERIYLGKAPEDLVRKSEILREARIRKLRAELLRQTAETHFKYYCSICLIIRDENEYLEEWLQWHIGQGVEHFYIYDHDSKQPVKGFFEGLGKEISEKVTVLEWKGKHADAQPDAYNDCLNRFRGESRWIGFIDADEHVRVKTGQTLPEFLKGYEEYAGVFANWVTYSADGQVKECPGPLRQRFRKEFHEDKWLDKAGKIILQPYYMVDMVIHNGRAADGFYVVDAHGEKVYNYSLVDSHPTVDFICVDHYFTKSYEEWIKKLRRGSGHAKYRRKYEEFFRVNPDMGYCREKLELQQKYEISEK